MDTRNAVMGQNSLWYTSSEAKDKLDTVIYVVNKTDRGVFSRLSASGTAELSYRGSSPPTAAPQTKKGGQPGGTASPGVLRGEGQSCARGCSNPSPSLSPLLGQIRLGTKSLRSRYLQPLLISEACVKFSVSYHLKLKCTAWAFHARYGKLVGVCSAADGLKFPFAAPSCFLFRHASHGPREAAQIYQNREKERALLTAMKL